MKRFSIPVETLCVGGMLLIFTSCTGGYHPMKGKNLLLVTIDTLRADHLGTYGYGRDVSPFIDGLSRQGILFENVYAQVTVTTASHASIMTGLYPFEHGLRANNFDGYILKERFKTLSEIFLNQGYTTAAFVGSYPVGSDSGLERDFLVFDEPDYEKSPERPAGDVIKGAIRFLETKGRGGRFFLWVHLYDPHGPYSPPPPFNILFYQGEELIEKEVARYDGEISYCDSALRDLYGALDGLGLLKDTLWVITSDHGETMLERPCYFFHGQYIYEEQLRIPLIFYWKGIEEKGIRISGDLESIHIAPFVLELMGLKGIRRRGVPPFRKVLEKGETGLRRAIFEAGSCDLEHCGRCEPHGIYYKSTGIKKEEWKLIRNRRKEGYDYELYHLGNDPLEKNNLAGSGEKVLRRMVRELKRFPFHKNMKKNRDEIPQEVKEKLRSLGY